MTERRAEVLLTGGLEMDPRAAPAPVEDRAFSIAVLGDFSGRGGRDAGRREAGPDAILIDRDDFDTVLGRIAPGLRLALDPGEPPIEIGFRELDDFHPDSLFDRLPLFRELRELRARLLDPATYPAAAAELRGDAPAPTGPAPVSASADGLLDLVVDTTAPDTVEADAGVLASADDLRAYVRRIVAPHLVAKEDPRQAETIAVLDEVVSERMRAILHHPRYRALESLWRGVYLLTRRVSTRVLLRLYLIDVTDVELRADLLGTEGRTRTPLRELLARGPEGGVRGPWGLLIGAYSFGPSDADVALLYALATVASAVGAPWISAAEPALVGCPSRAELADPDRWAPVPDAWRALRREPEASWLGLAMPRILVRSPYGENDEPCERFRFEEMVGRPDHEAYLWVNPALGCALLLGQAFEADGWRMRPGSVREIDGLPLHLVRDGGDVIASPCAEVWLTEGAADRIMEAGVMPFASRRDRDSVQLLRFQSAADPVRALSGGWSDP